MHNGYHSRPAKRGKEIQNHLAAAFPSPLAGEAESRSDREWGGSVNLPRLAPAPPSPTLPHKGGESTGAH
jgi:hypothetical protein